MRSLFLLPLTCCSHRYTRHDTHGIDAIDHQCEHEIVIMKSSAQGQSRTLWLSQIFSWFSKDFGEDANAVATTGETPLSTLCFSLSLSLPPLPLLSDSVSAYSVWLAARGQEGSAGGAAAAREPKSNSSTQSVFSLLSLICTVIRRRDFVLWKQSSVKCDIWRRRCR